MRTTLVIDDDVLEAAKAIARQRQRTIGDVISDLARKSLARPKPEQERNGIPLLSDATRVVTLETVNALRDETT